MREHVAQFDTLVGRLHRPDALLTPPDQVAVPTGGVIPPADRWGVAAGRYADIGIQGRCRHGRAPRRLQQPALCTEEVGVLRLVR
ncbi:MAG TPA: hypothetical protein VGD43_16515 [Micromonospora sp.]